MSCSDWIPPDSFLFTDCCTGKKKGSPEIIDEMNAAISEERYEWAEECRKELERRGDLPERENP
jgi:hypothetical protein